MCSALGMRLNCVVFQCRLPALSRRCCVACALSDEHTISRVVQAQDVSKKKKVRMDAFLSETFPEISRARIKTSIQMGGVLVNGAALTKASYAIKIGDNLLCRLPPPPVSTAIPEAIPLDIAFEDANIIIVNKPAGMVVHPSPGHDRGTLVNALLHHCGLASITVTAESAGVPVSLQGVSDVQAREALTSRSRETHPVSHGAPPRSEGESGAGTSAGAGSDAGGAVLDEDDGSDDDVPMPLMAAISQRHEVVMRPGIVHRLDKGTTGLIAVAKDDTSLTHLGAQFKVRRLYWAITVGVPRGKEGCVETNIGRHPTDRKKMGVYGYGSDRGREAVSTYKVLEELAGGTAALVQWRLKTGRTHQIRVHAQHLGCPLLGDEDYGGTGLAFSAIGRGHKLRDPEVRRIVKQLARPALHAKTLGFSHPRHGADLNFECELPEDFLQALADLRLLPAL